MQREQPIKLIWHALSQSLERFRIADRGYQTSKADETMLSLPSYLDSKELYSFKSQAWLRQETFNRRVHAFKSMSDTFRHGEQRLRQVFEAVVVTVQYQMDNGAEIFSV
eukprot:scaffold65842_cov43-Attheya_sp.AAC.1